MRSPIFLGFTGFENGDRPISVQDNFRSEYGNFKLDYDWILVIDIQGWKSLPIFDRNFDILESRILST